MAAQNGRTFHRAVKLVRSQCDKMLIRKRGKKITLRDQTNPSTIIERRKKNLLVPMKSSAFWRRKQFKAANNSGMGEKWAFFFVISLSCLYWQQIACVVTLDTLGLVHLRIRILTKSYVERNDLMIELFSKRNYFIKNKFVSKNNS